MESLTLIANVDPNSVCRQVYFYTKMQGVEGVADPERNDEAEKKKKEGKEKKKEEEREQGKEKK